MLPLQCQVSSPSLQAVHKSMLAMLQHNLTSAGLTFFFLPQDVTDVSVRIHYGI